MTTAEPHSRTYDWLHFAGHAGEAGRAWADAYRRYLPLVGQSDEALDLMRQGRLEAGHARLRAYTAALDALKTCPSSVRAMLDRFGHGVAGYYHYRQGEYARAEQSMAAAHEAVVEAVSHAGFLTLACVHCKEFRLHLARIARNRRRWREMADHVECARAMTLGQEPLCHTRDGRPVFFASIVSFLYSLEALDEREREAVRPLVDLGQRVLLFERFVRALEREPDVVIHFP